jgi:AcrR family transcriptional regulator
MTSESTRTYRKRVRAKLEQETRERITEAAVKLHGTVGPARTTISGVAREAGVQRATVYRHFPDEESLFVACSGHYWSRHPLPDIESWKAVRDPRERLGCALREFYDFYEENEEMLEKTGRDRDLVPAMAPQVQAFMAMLDYARSILMSGRRERGGARRRVEAAIGHALLFDTWRSLARAQGLDNAEAAAVTCAMVEHAGSAKVRRAKC